jgi:hypothetical protein
VNLSEIGDDEPIPLAEAAKLFFHGRLTKSSLRTEAGKGNLEIIRIANKDFVTRNGINRMIERCRRNEGLQGSGSGQTQERGTSRMEPSVLPQIAAKLRLQQLKQSLPSISQANTGHNAAVVPLKSR